MTTTSLALQGLDLAMPGHPLNPQRLGRGGLLRDRANQQSKIDMLETAQMAVELGKTLTGVIPVPGLPVVMGLLDAILKQAEKVRLNKEGVKALCKQIEETSNGIAAIVKTVEPKLQVYPAESSVQVALQDPQRPESQGLLQRVTSFESTLRDVLKAAEGLASRSRLQRWLSVMQDATTLADLKDRVAQAYQLFQLQGTITMESMLNTIVDQIIESETNRVLDRLYTGTNPGFRAEGNRRKGQFLQGTRTELLKIFDDWVVDAPGSRYQGRHALILEGGGGTGKSTIASEFCRKLQERGRLGASFFFTRGTPDLESAASVVPSVAEQLAKTSQVLRPKVTEAAKKHLIEGGRQQRVEFAAADLLEPLRSIELPEVLYIVVDALDECRDDEQAPQLPEFCRSLLSFVLKSTSFRLFLTTRPIADSPLRNAIQSFSNDLCTISLHDPLITASVRQDIDMFIRTQLASSARGREWCATNSSAVASLVDRADGLFIYARVAMTFLMEDSNFDERLRKLLPTGSNPSVKLHALNHLYLVVLHTAFPPEKEFPPKSRVCAILGCLIASLGPFGAISPYLLAKLLGLSVDQSLPILERLQPVLTRQSGRLPGVEYNRFVIMHHTFREFLTSDKLDTDATDFRVLIAEAHTVLAIGCTKLLLEAVKTTNPAWHLDESLTYAVAHWRGHASRSSERRDDLGTDRSIELEALVRGVEAVDEEITFQYARSELAEKLACDTEPNLQVASDDSKPLYVHGIRAKLFEELEHWVAGASPTDNGVRVFLVEGEAGMGKSTIAGEFCRRLRERYPAPLGTSLFFSRGMPGWKSTVGRFVTNLLGQLVHHCDPSLFSLVRDAAHKHLIEQGDQNPQRLGDVVNNLLGPLRSFKSNVPICIVIDALDALDECSSGAETPDASETIARWLESLLSFIYESSSFRLLITTRPTHSLHLPLRDTLKKFSGRTHAVSLVYSPTNTADEKIASIFANRLDAASRNPWLVELLTEHAHGLVEYAEMATLFLMADNLNCSFDTRLKLLMPEPTNSVDSTAAVPLNNLDKLYSTVLTTAFPPEQQLPPKERVRSVLTWLIIFPPYVPSSWRQYLSGIPPEQSVSILEKLRPVLTVDYEDIPVERREFRIMHDTFREFVTSDKSRAGNHFHISIAEAHTVVAIGSMKVLCAAVEPEGEGWAMDGWDLDRLWAVRYAYWNWEEYVSRSRDGGVVSEERDALAERVSSFLGTESQRDAFYTRWRKCYNAP